MSRTQNTSLPVKIGVSSCLLGEEVRYDGGHKSDPFLSKRLDQWSTGCRYAQKSR